MIPNVFELHDILFSTEACRKYLLKKDVFYLTLPCPGCGREIDRKDNVHYICPTTPVMCL